MSDLDLSDWKQGVNPIPEKDGFTPLLLAEKAKARGTEIKEGARCTECNHPQARYYYVRQGRDHNGCLWCHHLADRTPANIIGIVEVKPDGTEIFHGRKCSVCGETERLIKPTFGAKAKACYYCAVSKASDKAGQTAIHRAEQKAKHATNAFIIRSIMRAGEINVAPSNISEYFLVKALMEDCLRQNKLEEISESGIEWEIGHIFPASGGGTEYRGKATVSNLCLIEKQANRVMGDKLPTAWTIKQVVRVGDLYASISSVEAAGAWQARMGWNTTSEQEKARRIAQERQKDKAHKKAFTENVKPLVDALGWADIMETQFQAVYVQVSDNLSKTKKRLELEIENNRKHSKPLADAGAMYEQTLIERLTRCRIIRDTFGQLLDAYEMKNRQVQPTSLEDDNDLPYLVKRAALMWATDLLKNPKQIIQAFTHPILNNLELPKAWGAVIGDDGRSHLTVWNIKTGEEITDETKQPWEALAKIEWQQREQEKRDFVLDDIRQTLNKAEQRNREQEQLTNNHKYGDWEDWEEETDPEYWQEVRKAMQRTAAAQVKRKNEVLEQHKRFLRRWWNEPKDGDTLYREWEYHKSNLFSHLSNKVQPLPVDQSVAEKAVCKKLYETENLF